jgi:amidohydrolase
MKTGQHPIHRQRIVEEISWIEQEIIRLRRDFHSHPEQGFQEKRTASVISGYLSNLGVQVTGGIAGTGVSGLLEGTGPGRTVMLRADMDALPLQEKNDVEYKSRNEGVMHACGHDGHMAILLGTAAVLSRFRPSFPGRVKFVFQPAEENLGGARLMIREGVMENPQVDAAFGLHLINQIPCGYIGCRPGAIMAGMDIFTIRVLGKGGHSAMPEGGIDAIAMSGQVITTLYQSVSREIAPTPLIINIGTVHGGYAENIIADAVELSGTVRCLDEEVRKTIPDRMKRVLAEITSRMNGGFELDYREGYPVTANDEAMTRIVQKAAEKVVGPSQVFEVPASMASEDMSFYLREVPGAFFFVGAGVPGTWNEPHHNPCFNIDERSLSIGVDMMVTIVLDYLDSRRSDPGA